MKSIVFFNNKGGVGKTTLATNVASYMATQGSRILIVDADPQCNTTQTIHSEDFCQEVYIDQPEKHATLYSYLIPIEDGDASIDTSHKPIPAHVSNYKIDSILGHPKLSIIEDKLSEHWSSSLSGDIGGLRVTNWCNQLLDALKNDYDIIIFDVGPSLGALNRTILLSSDYIVSPLGCDIFSILGISNIAVWIKAWSAKYLNAISMAEKGRPEAVEKFKIITDLSNRYRLAGYTVQQYVSRKFKDGHRPVKAYDEIMKEIPASLNNDLGFIMSEAIPPEEYELANVPYLYSLIPLSQSSRTPIHMLSTKEGVVGSQFAQVKGYKDLMENFCQKLSKNLGASND